VEEKTKNSNEGKNICVNNMISKNKKTITKKQPIKKEIKKKLNVIDLFCGCGGMTTGLVNAGLNIVAGIDIWDKAVESYESNHDHLAICADLTKLSPSDFKRKYNINFDIDVIVGGPPCQGFSIAGKRNKNDPRNS